MGGISIVKLCQILLVINSMDTSLLWMTETERCCSYMCIHSCPLNIFWRLQKLARLLAFEIILNFEVAYNYVYFGTINNKTLTCCRNIRLIRLKTYETHLYRSFLRWGPMTTCIISPSLINSRYPTKLFNIFEYIPKIFL